jgi:hypothetical protein
MSLVLNSVDHFQGFFFCFLALIRIHFYVGKEREEIRLILGNPYKYFQFCENNRLKRGQSQNCLLFML